MRLRLIARLVLGFAAVTAVGCVRDSDSRVDIALGSALRHALAGFADNDSTRAVLSGVCDNGRTFTAARDFDTRADRLVFGGIEPCGPATLTLELWSEYADEDPVRAFSAATTATLLPRTDVDVVFSGDLYGEILLDPQTLVAGSCVLDDGEHPTVTVLLVDAPVSTSLPLGNYVITCTTATAEVVQTVALAAGVRSRIPVDLSSPLPVVENLAVTDIGLSSAHLTWSVSSVGSATSTIEVALDAAFTAPLVIPNLTVTAYDLVDLLAATHYWVRVTATDEVGSSAPAVVELVTIAIDPATLLAALNVDDQPLPGFLANDLSYVYDATYRQGFLTINATAADATSSVSIAGQSPTVGSASFAGDIYLGDGPLTFEIAVTNAAGTLTTTYVIQVVEPSPQLTAIAFTNSVVIEPPFDRDYAGPYVVYQSARAAEAGITLDCTPTCTSVVATLDGADVPFASGAAAPSVSLGAHGLSLTVIDTVSGEQNYDFTIVRGGLTTMTSSAGTLAPAFDPLVFSYFIDNAAATTVGFTYTAESSVLVAPTNAVLIGCNNQVPVTVSSPSGVVIDVYELTIRVPTTYVYDYVVGTDHIESGPLDTNLGQGRPSIAFDEVAKGPPITLGLQRPGTTNIYFLHYDGASSASAVSVRSLGPGGSLPLRARVATPVTDDDYMLDLGDGFQPMSIAFHPTAQLFYTWSPAGYVYAVPVTGPFVDGFTEGAPGLPLSPTAIGTQFAMGSGARVMVTPNGKWLLTVALGISGANLRVQRIDETTGALVNEVPAQTIAASLTDAIITREGGVLVVASASAVTPYAFDDATGMVTVGTNSTSITNTLRLLPHPTRDFFYAMTPGNNFSMSYVASTAVASLAKNQTSGPIQKDAAIEPLGVYYLIHTNFGSNCAVLGYPFDADGALDVGNGNYIDCSAINVAYATCK